LVVQSSLAKNVQINLVVALVRKKLYITVLKKLKYNNTLTCTAAKNM